MNFNSRIKITVLTGIYTRSEKSVDFCRGGCRDGVTVVYKRMPRLFEELEMAHGDGRFPRLAHPCRPDARRVLAIPVGFSPVVSSKQRSGQVTDTVAIHPDFSLGDGRSAAGSF